MDSSTESNNIVERRSELATILLLSWLALIEIIVSMGWFFNLNILAFSPLFSAVIVIATVFYSANRDGTWRTWVTALFIAILIVFVTMILSLFLHDFSSDGQQYHQQAILALFGGWNPIVQLDFQGPYAIWLTHYAKGPWIISASFMAISNNIEIGKSLNFILFICVALLTYYVLCTVHKTSKKFSAFIATLVAANPIFGYQIFSYYIDGQVSAVVILTGLFGYLAALRLNRSVLVGLAAAIILGVNTKFSVIPFLVIMISILLLYLRIAGQKQKFAVIGGAAFASFVVSIFIVGFNPYVTNTLTRGHPFYPLFGGHSVDIISTNVTSDFLQKNRLEKFALSLLSKSHSTVAENLTEQREQIKLKIPFSVYLTELESFYKGTDIRIGGFGPLMSGALVLTLLFLALRFYEWFRQKPHTVDWCGISLFGGLLASVLVFPESWWARYVPQFWGAIILIVAIALWSSRVSGFRLIGMVALVVFAINTIMVFVLSLAHQVVQEADFQAQINSLRKISLEQPIKIKTNSLEDSIRHRLTYEGVFFKESQNIDCPEQDRIIATGASFCIDSRFALRYVRGSPTLERVLGLLRSKILRKPVKPVDLNPKP